MKPSSGRSFLLAPPVVAVGSPLVVAVPVTGQVRPVFLLLLLKSGSTTKALATMVGSAAAAVVSPGARGTGLVFVPDGATACPQSKIPLVPIAWTPPFVHVP